MDKIGIITMPIGEAGLTPLSNLTSILQHIYKEVYIITGNAGSKLSETQASIFVHSIRHKTKRGLLPKIINHVIMQFKLSYFLFKLRDVKTWVFFLDSYTFILPVVTSKLLNKKILFLLAASNYKSAEAKNDKLSKIIQSGMLQNINYFLSDYIIVYASRLIKEWKLEKYEHKIIIAHRHILNFDKFKVVKKYSDRDIIIGYIGRLSEEKGVQKFIESIAMICNENKCSFIIGGDGDLRVKIDNYLKENNLSDKVRLSGWIPHDKLPEYLNQLKLIVLPSYTEGLPNIMLEAMACGTPVLATPVGAIPDVIRDGKTGFILQDNSSECIAESILRILDMPEYKLEKVSENARKFVAKEFTFENAIKKWRIIMRNL
jgi:glycosyltransferase involved in cell wall biosynthesis